MKKLLSLLFIIPLFSPVLSQEYLSPSGMDFYGKQLAIAEFDSSCIDIFDPAAGKKTGSVKLNAKPTGICVREHIAFVTAGGVHGSVQIIDLKEKKLLKSISVGHTPMSPVIHGDTLYICNRFDNNIMLIDVKEGNIIKTLPVSREPVALCLSGDGSKIWVGNLLPNMPSDGDYVSCAVTCYEGDKATDYLLSNGTQSIRGITMSPDGKKVAVTHILSRYQVPTTQLDRGWINTNAVTLLDTDGSGNYDTILLDDVDKGAANPWGIKYTADNKKLIVTLAGIHEITVIDNEALLEKIKTAKASSDKVNRLSFLDGIRRRIELPLNGPRALAVYNDTAFVAGYFSDNLVSVPLDGNGTTKDWSLADNTPKAPDKERRGHMYFNDASLCFQAWESCVSCHPDGRVDALNWDLMNDGIGNPKNTRSMLLSHRMPPVMTLGIRKSAEIAVKAGFKYIQFVEPTEDHTSSVDEYLKKMPLVASPQLRRDVTEKVNIKDESCILCHAPEIERGALTDSAKRGREVFKKAGCAECHPHPLFTTRKHYDVGTLKGIDKENGKQVTVPTLVEVWRTAPYFHDGRTTSLKEAVTIHNKGDKRGKTSTLSEQEIDDLVEYLKSL